MVGKVGEGQIVSAEESLASETVHISTNEQTITVKISVKRTMFSCPVKRIISNSLLKPNRQNVVNSPYTSRNPIPASTLTTTPSPISSIPRR